MDFFHRFENRLENVSLRNVFAFCSILQDDNLSDQLQLVSESIRTRKLLAIFSTRWNTF